MAMDARDFENIFIDFLSDKIDKEDLNHSEIARLAFNDRTCPVRAWQQMRKEPKEKRQRINLGEAFRICKSMGLSLSTLCGMIEGGLITQKTFDTPRPPKKSGRKPKNKIIQMALPNEEDTIKQ